MITITSETMTSAVVILSAEEAWNTRMKPLLNEHCPNGEYDDDPQAFDAMEEFGAGNVTGAIRKLAPQSTEIFVLTKD